MRPDLALFLAQAVIALLISAVGWHVAAVLDATARVDAGVAAEPVLEQVAALPLTSHTVEPASAKFQEWFPGAQQLVLVRSAVPGLRHDVLISGTLVLGAGEVLHSSASWEHRAWHLAWLLAVLAAIAGGWVYSRRGRWLSAFGASSVALAVVIGVTGPTSLVAGVAVVVTAVMAGVLGRRLFHFVRDRAASAVSS